MAGHQGLRKIPTKPACCFFLHHAIAASLRKLFLQDEDIDEELARQVIAIVNRRYKEFINNSPTDIYFTTFFLDPCESQ